MVHGYVVENGVSSDQLALNDSFQGHENSIWPEVSSQTLAFIIAPSSFVAGNWDL
jgi:hypothetical protein